MRPVKSDSPAPPNAPLSLFSCITDTAMRSLGDMLGMQNILACQLLTSVNLQQKAKSVELETWLYRRNEAMQDRLQQGVLASKEWYVATTQAQADWLQASERLLAEANRSLLQSMSQITPCGTLPAVVMEPVCKAIIASGCALESMTKATRQVTNFAGTNLGNAALNAARMVREEMSPHQPSAVRHH